MSGKDVAIDIVDAREMLRVMELALDVVEDYNGDRNTPAGSPDDVLWNELNDSVETLKQYLSEEKPTSPS